MAHADFIKSPNDTANFGEWWGRFYITDPNGNPIVFQYGRGHVNGGTYISSRNGVASISIPGSDTILAHAQFPPRLHTIPTITQSMWREGGVLTPSLPTYGQWSLHNGDRYFDQFHPKYGYTWAGGKCELFFFDNRDITGTIGRKLQGKMGNPSFGLGPTVDIPVFGREEDFNQPLHNRVYRGTSYGLELTGDKKVSFGVSPAAVNLRNDLTVKGWFYLEAVNTNFVVFLGLNGVSPWRFAFNAGKQLGLFGSVGGVTQSKIMSKVWSARVPYHMATVVSGRDVTFYIWDDANQVLTTEAYTNVFSVFTRDTAAAEYLVQSGSDPTLKLWVDELQVFNYAQTKLEIEADRFRPLNTGIPATCKHRIGFDDGTGTTATDSSTSALHGTISGAGTHTWLWQMEGGPELAGTPKPDTVGKKFGVKPVLVAPMHYAWQVHWGSTQSIQSSEGGANRTMSNAATLRDFIVTTPAAGNSLTYLANGLFKMPTGAGVLPISAVVEGAKDGSLGYVETVSKVSRYLATQRGPKLVDPAEIDTAAYTTFEMSSGFNPVIGWTTYDAQKAREVNGQVQQARGLIKDGMDLALRSALGWWGFVGNLDKLAIYQYKGASAANDYIYPSRSGAATGGGGVHGPWMILDIQEMRQDFVIYEVEVRYHYNDVVMSDEQVASSVKGTANWTQWTKPYLYKKATDATLRDRYQGKGGRSLVLETAIYNDADAQTLANMALARFKGYKVGYRVTLTMVGAGATIGMTEFLSYQYQDGRVVLGMDGSERLVIITTIDQSQQGTIIHELMP